MNNLGKYKKDLDRLILDGDSLLDAIQKALPMFKDKYQTWYSESLAIIKLLLPDRLSDFVRLYEKPKARKEVKDENYVIEDYLQGLTRGNIFGDIIIAGGVGFRAAIPQFEQQLNIVKSVKRRLESSLFDIKQLLQADLFDSELEAARELNKNGFVRGAGAMAGVVLEGHLSQVCENHKISITKKKPTINDYNQSLKDSAVIEVHDWRFIQHLGDLRNLCDHDKKKEPTKEQVEELIAGVEKISKTIF